MDKIYTDKIKRNHLTSLIRTVCEQMGGTGVEGYSVDDYAKDQLLIWGVSEEKLDEAIACFQSMKKV